jgi:hypothetical protein
MSKTFERSTAGLRDALMCEMEDVRAGVATPAEAQAFALLARTIISSMEAEIAEKLRLDAKEERERKWKDRELIRLQNARELEVLQLTYDAAEDA